MPSTHKLDESTTLTCTVCGKPYHPRRDRAATSRACSRACALRLGFHRKQGVDGAETRECPRCHRDFTVSRPEQKYCSTACARGVLPPVTKVCPYCHQAFTTRRREQVYCSRSCRSGAALAQIPHGAHRTSEAREKMSQANQARLEAGTHNFVRNREGTDKPESKPTAALTEFAPKTTPRLPELPELPTSEEDAPPEENERALAFPPVGADARKEWMRNGQMRREQADAALDHGDTFILAGQGSYLGVEGYALIAHQGRTHGVGAPPKDTLQPGMHNVRRIIWIGAHGYVTGTLTLAAVAWCKREGIHLTALDGAGMPLLESVPEDHHDAELRRRQWLVSSGIPLPGTQRAEGIVQEIVRRKVGGQAQALLSHPELPGQDTTLTLLRQWLSYFPTLATLEPPPAVDYLRKLEGRLAAAYFGAWEGWPLLWAKPDVKRVPPHWLSARTRNSPLSPRNSGRHAVDPLNACLNYAYGCLASQCRQSLMAEGFDMSGGFLHADQAGRDSLTYDLMELERGAVDDLVLSFLGKTTLHYADFAREASGQVALHPQLTRLLLAQCRVPQSRVDGHARWLRRLLLGESRGDTIADREGAPAETPERVNG